MKQIPIHDVDTRRRYVVPGDRQTTIQYSTENFVRLAQEAISERGAFSVALSGGSTPKAIFDLLACAPYKSQVDWKKVWLFWSDERCVPYEHPDSNYRMAMTWGLGSLGIPKEQIFPMPVSTLKDEKLAADLESKAVIYEKTLKTLLKEGLLDLVMLGMGDDGHVASLFPGTQALQEQSQWVKANDVPQKSVWRMTLTFPAINASRHIVVDVQGSGKAEMVKKVLFPSHSEEWYPAQDVGTPDSPALWILDRDAAGRI